MSALRQPPAEDSTMHWILMLIYHAQALLPSPWLSCDLSPSCSSPATQDVLALTRMFIQFSQTCLQLLMTVVVPGTCANIYSSRGAVLSLGSMHCVWSLAVIASNCFICVPLAHACLKFPAAALLAIYSALSSSISTKQGKTHPCARM